MIKDFWGIKGLLGRVLMVLIRDSKMIEFEVGVGYSTLVLLFLGNTKNGQNLQNLVSKTGQNMSESARVAYFTTRSCVRTASALHCIDYNDHNDYNYSWDHLFPETSQHVIPDPKQTKNSRWIAQCREFIKMKYIEKRWVWGPMELGSWNQES